MNKWVSYSLYPATMFGAFALYFLTLKLLSSHLIALYIGVSTSALFIFLLERKYPLHPEWIPSKKELVEDVFLYTVLVQAIFPLALYYLGFMFLEKMRLSQITIWPVQWPVVIQFLFMAVIGEFFQYWWHRLCHTYKLLWPAHAIHHFPQKLYAWNTARFHFADKFMEFFFTLFIFFALGMRIEVFAYYYLFYAITGYFQHSNLEVKFGLLDYVVASGETHRFHHDSNYEQSKCNYANNLVLFDLLFGTFKRDPYRKLKSVGVKAATVPVGLSEELFYPLSQMKKSIFDLILKLSMKRVEQTFVKDLILATGTPRETQIETLKRIIEQNSSTMFGKDYKFHRIHSYQEFKQNVPILDYEDHRIYIEKTVSGTPKTLTDIDPHYFAKTSGTTGKPKYIPINIIAQKSYMKTQQLISHYIYQKSPDFLAGEIFSVVGKDVEEMLGDRFECGSMSGKLYSLANPLVRAKHIFESDLAALNDSDEKYLYLAALALLSPNITFYASPNPSTLLKILETINYRKNDIKSILNNRDKIIGKYQKQFKRAHNLLDSENEITIAKLWPNLKVITLWMEGSCTFLLPRIKASAGDKVYFNELGYVSSEFYGSVPLGNVQVPTLLDNFFEFIEKDKFEIGERDTLLIDELNVGSEYYILATTPSGLYRYNINDIIKVVGKYNNCPVIAFSQKGKGVTNITGEKLCEKHLVNYFNDKDLDFFMCVADQVQQKYILYVESDSMINEDHLDEYLKSINVEFASKRNDRRLEKIQIFHLKKGAGELYKKDCLKNGQREAQFKFLHLQYQKDVSFNFKEHLK